MSPTPTNGDTARVTKLYKHDSGEWVTNWKGHTHKVFFDSTDGQEFVTLGLVGQPAIRFEVNPKGIILGVYDHLNDVTLDEVTIQSTHSLHLALNIGRPV